MIKTEQLIGGLVDYEEYQEELDSWLGTPFRHYSRVNQLGTDCIGMVLGVFEELGLIHDVELAYYSRDWWLHEKTNKTMESLLKQFAPKKIKNNYLPGDVMIYQMGRAKDAHCGLYTIRDTLIHSQYGVGVLESQLVEPKYLKRLNWAYRLKD